ncbi:MAG: aryl-sulfate sulfotransferase [bacterium]|nr:aryl-sulfate sulfotransferase [bacterium]
MSLFRHIIPVLLAGAALRLAAYEVLQGPTELLYWNTNKTCNGYTLFGIRGTTYLLDMEGRVVHTWPIGTNPHLLDNGNILDASKDDPSGYGGFTEKSWDGLTVWSYTETRTNYLPHHDYVRIYNPKLGTNTTLYIANKTVTYAQCIAAGCNPASALYTNAQMDAIVEVDMAGNMVWEYWFYDHLIQDFDATKSNYVGTGKSISNYPGRLNANLPGRPVQRDWLHCNSIDYNQTLDQIVINSVGGELYVIDHGNTFIAGNPSGSMALAAGPTGDFLYRFGDPARYSQGNPPSILTNWTESTTGNKQIGGAHHVSWIPVGMPGAGHLLLFNNAQNMFEHTQGSYVFELNAFFNASTNDTGYYVNPPDAGYDLWPPPGPDTDKAPKLMSRQIVWSYASKASHGMSSHIGSSAQRLANTNTLVCADTEGHIVEVTPDGEPVWEYINPITSDGILKFKRDNWPMYNSIFRAYRYPATHPALAGRTLTPGSTITGRTPSYTSP